VADDSLPAHRLSLTDLVTAGRFVSTGCNDGLRFSMIQVLLKLMRRKLVIENIIAGGGLTVTGFSVALNGILVAVLLFRFSTAV